MRKTFDEDAPPLPPGGMPPQMSRQMPCSTCKTPTDHETLRNLGSMCHACYEHYCRDAFDDEGQRARYMVGLQRSRAGR